MEINIELKEKLDRITCATLLTETLKYLLFHRFQIPLPFEQFKTEDARDRAQEVPGQAISTLVKKKRQLIADIEELLLNLFRIYVQVDVLDVLLVIGATVVNPKEIFSIKFGKMDKIPEADMLNVLGKENGLASRSRFVDKCCRNLARMLFTDPHLNDCSELKCTSIYCLILAPRESNIDWFKPKTSFKVPKRGKFYSINVKGESIVVEGEFEGHEDTLWFQAPTVVKGCQEPYK